MSPQAKARAATILAVEACQSGEARPKSLKLPASLFRTLSLIGTACKNNL